MPPRSEELPVSPTKRLLSDFVTTNEAQTRVKRFFLKCLEENLYGPALKSRIISELPWIIFIHQDVQSHFEIYKRVRDYLGHRNVPALQTPRSGALIAKRLLCAIWPEEDLYPALRVFQAIKQKTYQASPYAELRNHDTADLNNFCREVPALFNPISSAPPE